MITTSLQCRAAAALSAALVRAGGAHAAQTITLDADSLPSTQGWVYVAAGDGAGLAESKIFSVGDGELHQNSLGIGMTQGGGFIARRCRRRERKRTMPLTRRPSTVGSAGRLMERSC